MAYCCTVYFEWENQTTIKGLGLCNIMLRCSSLHNEQHLAGSGVPIKQKEWTQGQGQHTEENALLTTPRKDQWSSAPFHLNLASYLELLSVSGYG